MLVVWEESKKKKQKTKKEQQHSNTEKLLSEQSNLTFKTKMIHRLVSMLHIQLFCTEGCTYSVVCRHAIHHLSVRFSYCMHVQHQAKLHRKTRETSDSNWKCSGQVTGHPNAWHKMISHTFMHTHSWRKQLLLPCIYIIHDAMHTYNKNSHSFILTLMYTCHVGSRWYTLDLCTVTICCTPARLVSQYKVSVKRLQPGGKSWLHVYLLPSSFHSGI